MYGSWEIDSLAEDKVIFEDKVSGFSTVDGLLRSLKRRISVIPEKAGIQLFQDLKILWTPVSTGVTTFYDPITVGF
jgi:hypothetical protein